MESKYFVNETAFDKFTPEMAYWLGMMASDGWLINGRGFGLAAKIADKEHIIKFKEFLSYSGEVRDRDTKCRGKIYPSSHLLVYNKNLYDRLYSLGLREGKSNLDIDYLNYVPNKFKIYFIIGYLDGDGSIALLNFKENEKYTGKIDIMGNKSLMESIYNFLLEFYNIQSIFLYSKKDKKYYVRLYRYELCYSFAKLYIGSNLPCLLNYKKERMQRYIEYKSIWDKRRNRTKRHYFCNSCGREIKKNSVFCIECAQKQRRKVERPSRERLKKEIRENSFLALSQYYKVSDNAIRKWCIYYNLPYKLKELKKYSDEEWKKI